MDINEVRKSCESRYGKGVLMTLASGRIKGVEPLSSSGFHGLDKALGIGGYPKERIIEIYGPESGGKTTLTLHAIAEVQKAGGQAAFIDVEHALDVRYAQTLGVNLKNLLICQPDYGEQGVDVAVHMLEQQRKKPDKPLLIVIDSVDALVPKKEIDGDFDVVVDENGKKVKKGGGMGLRARLMSGACRSITTKLKGTNATVIFINQIRHKIGVMFGSPETTSGGNALKFYASVRLDIRHIGQYKEDDVVVGSKFRVLVRKNKVAAPFQTYEGLNYFGEGIQKDWDLQEALIDAGLTEKSGSWREIPGVKKKYQGYRGFRELISEDKMRKQVEALLKGK